MTRIKICGIKETEHALALTEKQVDYLGLVFAESPRRVTVAQAKHIVTALKGKKNPPETVGVFVDTPTPIIRKIAENCGLDWIQLSGDEPWEFCRELDMPIIKVVRISRDQKPGQLCADLEYGTKLLGNRKYMFLLDSNSRDKYGGTGRRFDWKLAKPIAERFPVIVAGGLNPENVKEAIEIISPWGVDVSSGVETKSVKDMTKIMRFIETVRRTDGDLS